MSLTNHGLATFVTCPPHGRRPNIQTNLTGEHIGPPHLAGLTDGLVPLGFPLKVHYTPTVSTGPNPNAPYNYNMMPAQSNVTPTGPSSQPTSIIVQPENVGLTALSGQATTILHAFTTETFRDYFNGAWNMDTGASSHLNSSVNSLCEIFNTCMYPSISVGDGHSISVTNTGHSILPTSVRPLHLKNVFITPHIVKNLIYVRQFICDNNCTIAFDAFGFSVKDFMTRRVLLRCDSTGDLYPVTHPSLIPRAFLVSQHMWHQRLGHPEGAVLRRLVSNNVISCNNEKPLVLCYACQLGKHVRLSFENSNIVVTSCFEIIHSDVSVPTYTFLDDSPDIPTQPIQPIPVLDPDNIHATHIPPPNTNPTNTNIAPSVQPELPAHATPSYNSPTQQSTTTHDTPPHIQHTHVAQQTPEMNNKQPLTAQNEIPHLIIPNPPENSNPDSVHPMVMRFRVGTNRPTERLNLHVSSVSPLPKSYHEAFSDPNWQNATRDEYRVLIENKTWVLVPRPTDTNIVRCMWIFRHKYLADGTLSRYKARLVANGSTQLEDVDVDETFSLVFKPDTIRMVLSLAIFRHWPVHQIDVKMPFYMVIYLRQFICISHQPLLQRIIASLHQEFSMTDLGSLNYFLGISVTLDSSRMFSSVVEILEKAHMVNCNSSRTPVDSESKLGADGDPISDPTLYRSLAGSLQYLTFTRPNISYAVQQVCLYMHDPREPHFSALKRVLRYVRGTLDYALHLFFSSTTDLVVYSDADWAGCPTTRRSTSCYCVFLGNNLISWSVKRQPTLSRSSAEAEYRGVAIDVAETCWLRNLLRELHTPLSFATLFYCDNVNAVYLSTNPVQHHRTKHIEIDIHFVRDLVAARQVHVLHVPSRYQFADIFTKGLPSALFEEFRTSLSVRCPPALTVKESPPTCHVEESEGSGTSGVRSTSSDSTAPLLPDHPLTRTTPALVPILCRTARMTMRVLRVMSPGLSAGIAEVAAMFDSIFRKRFRSSYDSSPSPTLPVRKRYRRTSELILDTDSEEDEEVEECLDSDSVSEDAEDEGPTAKDDDPTAGDEGLAARDEGPGMRVESRGLDDEGHRVEGDGLGLGEKDEVVPEGQQQAASVVGTAVSAHLGLGYGALRRRELVLEEDHVYNTFESTLAMWTDPEDGMVYIDVPVYPPLAPPVQTPPSSEWSSSSFLISPSPSIVPLPISSPMISLTVPSPIASPVATPIATIPVNEDQSIEVGAQLELYLSILQDHTQRLDAMPPTLFAEIDRDARELYTRSGTVRDEIFS
uniref:Ribonuclease H-like domain-containing protein n=1 Tax=Tanacetum cinerariifolium TaxID=118510 RepID=A0A6L2LNN4_TANCI|nr:ribonuclease H-like domain-containing protein [Tanacetum cinerariifolium]